MTFEMIHADTQLMYASDYPHWDFDLPSTIADLSFLSMQAKQNILGETALKLFNLERPVRLKIPVVTEAVTNGGPAPVLDISQTD